MMNNVIAVVLFFLIAVFYGCITDKNNQIEGVMYFGPEVVINYGGGDILYRVAKNKKIKILGIRDEKVSNEDLCMLSGITALELFSLSDFKLNRTGIDHISNIKKLSYLSFNNVTLDAKNMSFSKLNNIKSFQWGYNSEDAACSVNDRELQYLSSLVSLNDLELFGISPVSWNIGSLECIPSLHCVFFRGDNITDNVFNGIERLPSLSNIQVMDGQNITDKSLEIISQSKKIVYVDFYNTSITGRGIKKMNGMKSMKRMAVKKSKLIDSEMKNIDLSATNIVSLDFSYNDLTGEFLRSFIPPTSLRYIGLGGNKIRGEEVYDFIKRYPKYIYRFESIVPAE